MDEPDEDGFDDREWAALERHARGVVVYHSTAEDAARAILEHGFRDAAGTYMLGVELTGVWVSNRPLDVNEGTKGEALLRIVLDVDEASLEYFEIQEDGKTYREWCVPASILNQKGAVERVDQDPSTTT